ncbi:hypothetical protein TNIN_82221, partial [Trichonephila inaurata madagascariensis]
MRLTSLRHLSLMSSKIKISPISSPSKPACFIPVHPNPSYQYFCTLPACVWPINLPPATEWGYGVK